MAGRPESEREFQGWVIDLAHQFGWKVAHFRPSMNRRGQWSTAVEADGAGFPDLVMAGGRRKKMIIFAELKSARGKTTLEQDLWSAALELAADFNHVHVCLWRPSDRPEIEKLLSS